MSLQSFECQIAKGQIGRYLAGEAFSAEALRQLEAHVSSCEGCKAYLGERKAALQSMLKPSPVPAQPDLLSEESLETALNPAISAYLKATEAKEARAEKAANANTSVLSLLKDKTTSPQASFWKPFAYSLALAVVLGGMSLASRHMDGITGGEKVLAAGSELRDADKPETPTKTESPKPKSTGKAAQALKKPTLKIADNPHTGLVRATPTPPLNTPRLTPLTPLKSAAKKKRKPLVLDVEHVINPKPHHRMAAKPHARKIVKKARRAAPRHIAETPRESVQAIRVYDSEGNPIRP